MEQAHTAEVYQRFVVVNRRCGVTAPDAGEVSLPGSQGRVQAPGSDEAIKAGCTCSAADNYNGEGFSITYNSAGREISRAYYIRRDCPVHDPRPDPLDNPTMRPRTDAETGGRDVD